MDLTDHLIIFGSLPNQLVAVGGVGTSRFSTAVGVTGGGGGAGGSLADIEGCRSGEWWRAMFLR